MEAIRTLIIALKATAPWFDKLTMTPKREYGR